MTPFGQAAGRVQAWVAKVEFQNDPHGRGRHAA